MKRNPAESTTPAGKLFYTTIGVTGTSASGHASSKSVLIPTMFGRGDSKGYNESMLLERKVSLASVLIAACFLGIYSVPMHGMPRVEVARAELARPSHAPKYEIRPIDLKGYQALLLKYRGKPVMVNMWATWCEPCRSEYPMVVGLARRYKPRGLVVLGVNFDDEADTNVARDFLKKNAPDFLNYHIGRDEQDEFIHGASARWDGSLPSTLFYDREGHLVRQFVGSQPPNVWTATLENLLAGSRQ